MDLYLPVVVVEGRLVQAVLAPKGEPDATEVDRVYVHVENPYTPSPALGPKYEALYKWLGRFWGSSHLVTVVTLEALSAFLEDVKQSVASLPSPPKHVSPDYSELDRLVQIHLAFALKRGQ